MNQIRVLFISRKHPPSVGGMQRLSYHLVQEMSRRVHARAVIWGGSARGLPLFLPYALARSLQEAARGVHLICAGDPVMALIGSVVSRLYRVPVVTVVHGLDVTFPFPPYQWLLPRVLRAQKRVVCISSSAKALCVSRGLAPEKCVIIHPGVSVPELLPEQRLARDRVGRMIGRDIRGTALLVTVGRLVRRKGVAWFIQSVFSELAVRSPDLHYLIVGDGPEARRVRAVVAVHGLSSRVSVVGHVPEEDLRQVYAAADLFVMPNIPVAGDVEGFGLVALEAAAHAIPVLAADLDGIRDAVVPGRTGYLITAGEATAWINAISELLHSPGTLKELAVAARETVRTHCSWSKMAEQYESVFRDVCGNRLGALDGG